MNSDDLTREQARVIAEKLFPGVNYLVRLKMRMEKVGFQRDDKLYLSVCAAYDASLKLSHELHSMATTGTGKPDRPEK